MIVLQSARPFVCQISSLLFLYMRNIILIQPMSQQPHDVIPLKPCIFRQMPFVKRGIVCKKFPHMLAVQPFAGLL